MKVKWANIFILSVGRSGSNGFARACAHISNYTSGHETRSWEIGDSRLDYPKGHIESDNKLSWMLGVIDDKFGDDAFYVHLVRKEEEVVKSWNQRWERSFSNIKHFAQGVLSNVPELLSDEEKQVVGEQYYNVANSNISMFLKDKSHVITVRIEDFEEGFRQFWTEIGAEGDLESALNEFKVKHNASLRSVEVAQKDLEFKREIREKIFEKRIREATTRIDRVKLKFRLTLFRLTGLRSEDF